MELACMGGILLIAVICMYLNHSARGSILLLFNLLAIWYMCDRWEWTTGQIKGAGLVFVVLFFDGLIFPRFELYNPNVRAAGTVWLTIILCNLIVYFGEKLKYGKVLQGVLLTISLIHVLVSRSRGALIALLFFSMLQYMCPKKIKEHSGFYSVLYVVLHIFTGLFVFAYTKLSLYVDPGISMGGIFHKRIFSTRDIIWRELWRLYREHIFVGCGSNVKLPSFEKLNVHNSLFNILAVFGIMVFLLTIVYIWKKIQIISNWKRTVLIETVLDSAMSVYVLGIFETSLVWAPMVVLWMFPLILLKSKKNEEKNSVEGIRNRWYDK